MRLNQPLEQRKILQGEILEGFLAEDKSGESSKTPALPKSEKLLFPHDQLLHTVS